MRRVECGRNTLHDYGLRNLPHTPSFMLSVSCLPSAPCASISIFLRPLPQIAHDIVEYSSPPDSSHIAAATFICQPESIFPFILVQVSTQRFNLYISVFSFFIQSYSLSVCLLTIRIHPLAYTSAYCCTLQSRFFHFLSPSDFFSLYLCAVLLASKYCSSSFLADRVTLFFSCYVLPYIFQLPASTCTFIYLHVPLFTTFFHVCQPPVVIANCSLPGTNYLYPFPTLQMPNSFVHLFKLLYLLLVPPLMLLQPQTRLNLSAFCFSEKKQKYVLQ